MKKFISPFVRKNVLGVALLAAFVAAPMVQSAPAEAQPRRDRDNNGRRGYDRDRYDRDRDYRTNYDRDNRGNNQTYSGRVTNVRSDSSFDLRANGRIYNVYAVGTLPRRLNENDEVRVYGRAYGDNDIRNANVRITDNNRDNDGRRGYDRDRYDRDRDYRTNYDRDNRTGNQTYRGRVTNVRSDSSFDLRANGRTYNVYAVGTLPRRLSDNDEVRVYGRAYGDNDNRNANVVLTDNNDGRGNYTNGRYDPNGKLDNRYDRDDNSYGPYRSFTGTVTNMKNDREFDVRIGGETYNVYASSDTRDLNNGDEVRIYGRSYGVNDIRNANVRITRNR